MTVLGSGPGCRLAALGQKGCLGGAPVAKDGEGVRLEGHLPAPCFHPLLPTLLSLLLRCQYSAASEGDFHLPRRSCSPALLTACHRWSGEASNINPSESLSRSACLHGHGEEAPAAVNHCPLPRATCPSSLCFTALTPARI